MSLSESLSLAPSLPRRRHSDGEDDPNANCEREGGGWFQNKVYGQSQKSPNGGQANKERAL